MKKDTMAHRALALALLLPLATAACADEGIEEDLDTDFEATEPATEPMGEEFSLEEMNDSGVEGEGWARVQGDSLVVALDLEDQARASEDLSLFIHRGDCGDEEAPMVTEMQRDRTAGTTGAPTGAPPGQEPTTGDDAAAPGAEPGDDATAPGTPTTQDRAGQTGMAGAMMTYTAPLSALDMGAPAGDTDADEADGRDDMDEDFSVRAHPAGAGAAGMDAEDDEGRALFCGDLPDETLRGGTGFDSPAAPTGTPDDATTGEDADMR